MKQTRKSLFTEFSISLKFALANSDCIMFLEDGDMNLLLYMRAASSKPLLLRMLGGREIASYKDIFEIHLNTFFSMCLTELNNCKGISFKKFVFQIWKTQGNFLYTFLIYALWNIIYILLTLKPFLKG